MFLIICAIEKSGTNIVPKKGQSKTGSTQTAADALEERTVTKGKFGKDRLKIWFKYICV